MSIARSIYENYQFVVDSINNCASKVGRSSDLIRIVAVTKFQPVDRILQAIEAGVTNLGENYAAQAAEKIKLITNEKIQWHMIGHIQSRKAELVVDNFDYIHTIDSLKIARKISDKAIALGKRIDCLVELNIANEETKSGYLVNEGVSYEQFREELSLMRDLSGIRLNGLMAMPPVDIQTDMSIKYFNKVREILEESAKLVGQNPWKELSMGTSSDYRSAIECGSTIVRIGTSIFGERIER